jgi:hypothetical protein
MKVTNQQGFWWARIYDDEELTVVLINAEGIWDVGNEFPLATHIVSLVAKVHPPKEAR